MWLLLATFYWQSCHSNEATIVMRVRCLFRQQKLCEFEILYRGSDDKFALSEILPFMGVLGPTVNFKLLLKGSISPELRQDNDGQQR